MCTLVFYCARELLSLHHGYRYSKENGVPITSQSKLDYTACASRRVSRYLTCTLDGDWQWREIWRKGFLLDSISNACECLSGARRVHGREGEREQEGGKTPSFSNA